LANRPPRGSIDRDAEPAPTTDPALSPG
jgi:hypothetical protein